jgi:beta-N-acetylhexosaminidase
MTKEELAGRRLMVGLPGPALGDEELRLLRETRAGGLILYRRNFESPGQLLALLERADEALGRRLLVATDQEGGRVIMLGEGVTIFPDALAAGASGDPRAAGRQGQIEARELRRLGVDLNLAPVLDVLGEAPSPAIGTRAYGKDPALVARLGAARILGMRAGGLASCAKHFPGLGAAALDPHLSLPVVGRVELAPFAAALAAGVDAVMTTHALYPALEGVPATFSARIVSDLLRGELGFAGAVLTDDLEMGALRGLCPPGEAAVRAAEAGHDLLLVCHTAAAQREAFRALVEAARSGRLGEEEMEASVERIERLRRRESRAEGGEPRPEVGGPPLAKAIASQAVTLIQPGPADWRRRLNGRVGVVFPRLGSLADRLVVEPPMLDEGAWLARAFAPYGITPEILLVGVEPSEDDVELASALAGRSDAALLFLYDAHLCPSNRRLLERCQGAARALGVLLLRNPYDAAFLRPGVLAATAFGFRLCQLDALLARVLV